MATFSDIAELRRIRRKIDNIRGPGVTNNADGVYIATTPAKDNEPKAAIKLLTVKLTSRDGSDHSKYAWQVERRTTSGWEAVTDGLTGTTSTNPAYNLDSTSTADLTNNHVVIALMPFKNADSTSGLAWQIIGAAFGSTKTVVKTINGAHCEANGSISFDVTTTEVYGPPD